MIVKQTSNNVNFRTNGQFANGNRISNGRPKGAVNKYTRIKEDILEIWCEEDGKERFRELFTGSNRDFVKALEIIIRLMPKDDPEESLADAVLRLIQPNEDGSDPNGGVKVIS